MEIQIKAGSSPLIMGILNVTPDSFSGDGVLRTGDYVGAAVAVARAMVADGADILDVGGESSRPGSVAVAVDEEVRRVVPVMAALRQEFPALPLSVDTVKPVVARAALAAGADIINDISGAAMAPAMLALAAETGAYLVLMHNRAGAAASDARVGGEYAGPAYGDVVAEVGAELWALADRVLAAGVRRERIWLDPGLGFGKSVDENLRLVRALARLGTAAGGDYPLLVGPSRKSFIGRVLNVPPEERVEGTAAVVAACVLNGAAVVRVHDVRVMARVARMAAAVRG